MPVEGFWRWQARDELYTVPRSLKLSRWAPYAQCARPPRARPGDRDDAGDDVNLGYVRPEEGRHPAPGPPEKAAIGI